MPDYTSYLWNSGYRPDTPDRRDFLFADRFGASPAVQTAVPISVDNRHLLRTILDQGQEGSCVGFAVCTAAEVLYKVARGSHSDLSERWIYHHARKYDPWPGTNYSGTEIRGALRGWEKHGICLDKFWKYNPYTVQDTNSNFDINAHEGSPSRKMIESARDYPIHGYLRVRTHRTDLKQAVLQNKVVIVGATVHTGWQQPIEGTIPFNQNSRSRGGHAFVIIGYDDRKSAFLVANSWGVDWGRGGFAWMNYKDIEVNGSDAWIATVPHGD